MTVRTRFAPSPTGYLHIGGVRTALFNWLLARQAGGQFILRIDDTDQQRNVQEALQPILNGFRWLGIDWDEGPEVGGKYGPYFQSQRSERYRHAVEQLLGTGAAYRDYATTEELQELRASAEAEKRDFIYDRRFMAETPEQMEQFEREGRQAVVRLKMPRRGHCEFYDAIRGQGRFEWAKEQDHVIQRADGSCLYHLANVVDDHDFEITHVVRAVEHYSNTPRQIFIAQSLGYDLPTYAHIPFVAEPGSQNKLSKRKIDKYLKHRDFKKLFDLAQPIAQRLNLPSSPESFNPVLVNFYRQIGFLPDALLNYLLLLGWSLDDKTEDFTRNEMIDKFSLDRVMKSPASFDPAKLTAFQHRRFNQLDLEAKTNQVIPFLVRTNWIADPPQGEEIERVKSVLRAAEDRLTVAGDIYQFGYCFLPLEEITYDEKAFEKRIRKPEEACDLLNAFQQSLSELSRFSSEEIDRALHEFVENRQIKIGQIIHALRVAVTGQPSGFSLFDTMAILGKEECLKRIQRAIEVAG